MPSNTTSSVVFFYTYILESQKDGDRYIGYSQQLKERVEEHKKGSSFATKFRPPFKLIYYVYYEACLNKQDAIRRERYLKTTQGRRLLGLRLREYTHNQKAYRPGS